MCHKDLTEYEGLRKLNSDRRPCHRHSVPQANKVQYGTVVACWIVDVSAGRRAGFAIARMDLVTCLDLISEAFQLLLAYYIFSQYSMLRVSQLHV